jgi:hypothetical protein
VPLSTALDVARDAWLWVTGKPLPDGDEPATDSVTDSCHRDPSRSASLSLCTKRRRPQRSLHLKAMMLRVNLHPIQIVQSHARAPLLRPIATPFQAVWRRRIVLLVGSFSHPLHYS